MQVVIDIGGRQIRYFASHNESQQFYILREQRHNKHNVILF